VLGVLARLDRSQEDLSLELLTGGPAARGLHLGGRREQGVVHSPTVGVALGRVGGEAAQHHALERRREALALLRGARDRAVEDLHADLGEGPAGEGQLPGQRVVHHRAEGEDVGTQVEVLPAHLLRAHVEHGPDQHALLGDVGLAGRAADAEVEQLDVAVRQDHHVGRLQVAVDQRAFVHQLEGRRHLQADAQPFLIGERPLGDQLVEGPPLEELHRDVGGPAVRAVLVDGRDVRVLEGAGVLRLALEATDRLGVELHVRTEDLERHRPTQTGVDGPEHLALGTFPQAVGLGLELEVAELHRRGRPRMSRRASGARILRSHPGLPSPAWLRIDDRPPRTRTAPGERRDRLRRGRLPRRWIAIPSSTARGWRRVASCWPWASARPRSWPSPSAAPSTSAPASTTRGPSTGCVFDVCGPT
jgi:hypothetical protein